MSARKEQGIAMEYKAKDKLIELGYEILWHNPTINTAFDMVVKKEGVVSIVEVKSSSSSMQCFMIKSRKLAKLIYLDKPIIFVFVGKLGDCIVTKMEILSHFFDENNWDLYIQMNKYKKVRGSEEEILSKESK